MRLGLLSTARINGAILEGAQGTDRVDVVAVASRDGANAQAYASEHGLRLLAKPFDIDDLYAAVDAELAAGIRSAVR